MELNQSSNATNRSTNAKRKEIIEKKAVVDRAIKTACAEKDHLSAFPAFRCYHRNGLSVLLESGRGDKLSSAVKKYIPNLLKLNMEGPYGPEWPMEEKVKRKEMVAHEARYIFVYEALCSSAFESSISSEAKRIFTNSMTERGSIVGFVNYRFVIEEEIPVLYVYELQLEHRVQGKGLGNFLMQLIELIAQKNHMGAVLLTVQKANLGAMSFYMSKLRYKISASSPSRVDPSMGSEKSYEILCKTFSPEAKAIFDSE
ncbi:hypothetical protein UlMin_008852, partial [Ulmus minor]